MRVLVTGGAGYIGTHTCLELLKAGHDVYVVDNLSNSSFVALERTERLSGQALGFTKCDIRQSAELDYVFNKFQPETVIHFAGLKAVGQSVNEPALYYDVNVGGLAVLLRAMDRVNCSNIVFSSSATVYGQPQYLPCDENHQLKPINPYGRTKLAGEELLRAWSSVTDNRHALALRYFNPVGAVDTGELGEDPNGIPNNLMPFIAQVAIGRRDFLQIFGNDYATIDGTGVRDYIHVVDLARAHTAAVNKLVNLKSFEAINIGTGNGISVLQMIMEFKKQSGRDIKFEIAPRRVGDAPAVWADASAAHRKLGFKTKLGITEMCKDSWCWQSANPNGYRDF